MLTKCPLKDLSGAFIFHLHRIAAIMEAGLFKKWLTVYFNGDDGDECDKSLTHVRHKRTSLDHTSGAFVAFTIGIVASLIVFFVEVTIYNIRVMIENLSVSLIRLFERKWHTI